MSRLNVASPLFRCALGIVFLALLASESSASVIYEFRELGSTAVIGTLEVMEPPASIGSGWSTTDSSDVISLFLDDAVFGLGLDDLLSAGGALNVFEAISSLDGSELDQGGMGIAFPIILPPNPADPTTDRALVFAFDGAAGGDFIGLATYLTFPDGSVIVGDLFLNGDWAAVPDGAVPEPGTFALLGMALLAAVPSALRRRAKRAVECRVSYTDGDRG
jgi:hypothetical protein